MSMDSVVYYYKSCTNCCYCKRPQDKSMVQSPANPSCVPASKKLDGVATWLINGFSSLFFTSLERCSCIYIDTIGDSDDTDHNLPLICKDGYLQEAKVGEFEKTTGMGKCIDVYIEEKMVDK